MSRNPDSEPKTKFPERCALDFPGIPNTACSPWCMGSQQHNHGRNCSGLRQSSSCRRSSKSSCLQHRCSRRPRPQPPPARTHPRHPARPQVVDLNAAQLVELQAAVLPGFADVIRRQSCGHVLSEGTREAQEREQYSKSHGRRVKSGRASELL